MPKRSDAIIEFIECLRIPEGSKVGQPLKLEPFQKKFIRDIYDNPKGTRNAFLSVARKNGKSALIAAILLVHIVGPVTFVGSFMMINFKTIPIDLGDLAGFSSAVVAVALTLFVLVVVLFAFGRTSFVCVIVTHSQLCRDYLALAADAATFFFVRIVLVVVTEKLHKLRVTFFFMSVYVLQMC